MGSVRAGRVSTVSALLGLVLAAAGCAKSTMSVSEPGPNLADAGEPGRPDAPLVADTTAVPPSPSPVPDSGPAPAAMDVPPPVSDAADASSATTDTPPGDVAPPPVPGGPAHVYVSGAGTVSRLALDDSGGLAYADSVPSTPRTSSLAIAPDGSALYAQHGNTPGRVLAFAIARDSGKLTAINEASSGGMGLSGAPAHLAVHPTGRWVVVAHLNTGHLAVLPIQAGGGVGAAVEIARLQPGAHHVVFDAAGTHLLVPCRDSDVVAQALFDPATGKITSNQPAVVAAPGGSGPRHLALSPDQRFAYLMTEFSGTVIAYRYDASAGTLSQPASIRSAPAGANENAGGHVMVHPNGRFVYASNRNSNSLAMFSVDPATGHLTSLGHVRGGGLQFPRDFDLDPAGRFLVVGNEEAGTALVFRVDGASGLLTKIGGPVKAGAEPYGVRILPTSVLGMRP